MQSITTKKMTTCGYNKIDWKPPTEIQYRDYIEYSSQIVLDRSSGECISNRITDEEESECNGYDSISDRNRIYIPGKVYFPLDVKSTLTKKEQAISLNILKYFKMGGTEDGLNESEKYDYEIYKSLENKIREENIQFLNYAKNKWEGLSKAFLNNVNPVLIKHAEQAWKNKLDMRGIYPRYYTNPLDTISLSYDEYEPRVLVNLLQQVSHFGQIAEYVSPIVFVNRHLYTDGLPNLSKSCTLNSKLPVSHDDNIATIIENYDFDVVVTASTLTKLIDETGYNNNWDVPVVVKNHMVGTNKKKVIYIDKPLPNKNPTQHDIVIKSFKDLIRTTYCRFPSVCFPIAEKLRQYPKDVDNVATESLQENESKIHQDETEESIINKKLIHNVNYKIWSISLDQEKNHLLKRPISGAEIKFLVRCKIDACEPYDQKVVNNKHTADIGPGEPGSFLKPLVMLPKIEQQIELGGSISTKSEMIKQWMSLFFRPNSELRKVRLTSYNKEVVSIDNVNLQTINHDAISYYKFKPVLKLGILHKIFSKLLTLEVGNYLLRHTRKQGHFVNIMQAKNKTNGTCKGNTYDLHFEYNKENNCQVIPVKDFPWCVIDVHYILPQHLAYKRMPGMFAPLVLPNKRQGKKQNSNKNEKKNNKN